MQISITREDLLKPLSQVAGIVERRQTLPILSNILVSADGEGLTLTGTDLEVEAVAVTAVKAVKAGEITVPARKLLDICRALPAQAEINITVEGEKVGIRSGQSRFSLVSLPVADFPNLETTEWDASFTLAQRTLKGLFERTQFSMAQQDVRYYLNGLLLEIADGKLRAVATDGHRMAVSETDLEAGVAEARQSIVPKKGVHELTRFLEDTEDSVAMRLSRNHLRVEVPGLTVTTKLIDGRFPDYTKVIPPAQNKVIILNRDQFRDALNRAAILSNERYRGIRFSISPGKIVISAHNPEQEEAREELGVEYTGEELEVGFNSNYMVEAVNALDSETVELGLSDTNSSGTLRSPGNLTTQYVVMPMRL